MVNQIKKNSKDIQSFLSEIENCDLFRTPEPNADGTLLQCKEYFEFVESKRRYDLTELNKKYKLIGPLVTKVEGLVCNTNSSRSPKMASYYAYWEKEIFNTISKVTRLSKSNPFGLARMIKQFLALQDDHQQLDQVQPVACQLAQTAVPN